MFFRSILMVMSVFYLSAVTAAPAPQTAPPPPPSEMPTQVIDIQTTLPKVTFGRTDAPLKIVMLHSLNCGHCKEIKQTIIPQIKEKFIDKGLVNLTLVDFPTNPQALDAAKVAWESRDVATYEKISEALVAEDEQWAKPEDTSEQICKVLITKQLMTEAQCQQGLHDENLGKEILRLVFDFGQHHQIDFAPAFIFNGKLKENPSILTIGDIEDALKKLPTEPSQINTTN